MKTMITCIFGIIAVFCTVGRADMVYDIDYEPPTYTNGQFISGAGTISDSINGFSSQGLLLRDGGGLSYLAPEPFTSGIHRVRWDFSVPVDQSSSMIINAQLDSQTGPVLFDTTLGHGPTGNEIKYGSGFPNRPSTNFVFGQSYSFEVTMDLDADYYSFWLDGNLLENTVSIPSDADFWGVDFGQNQTVGLQAGIDNFSWEVIPEPSSMLFLLWGGTLLITWRRKSQSA